jgi:type I restriction enzyme S subunit
MKIPLPPVAEQRRIAAILDEADAIRRKRREAIGLLDEFLRSAFLEMFGDPAKSLQWVPVTIEEIAQDRGSGVVIGPFGSNLVKAVCGFQKTSIRNSRLIT